jgi:hypothetical protein
MQATLKVIRFLGEKASSTRINTDTADPHGCNPRPSVASAFIGVYFFITFIEN